MEEQSEAELLARPAVADHEVVLRALHPPFWDPEKQRATPSAFGNGNLFSVSRPAILPEEKIIAIWQRDLETPNRRVEALARISVADLQSCGAEPGTNDQSAFLNVVADPTDDNPAHAEIMGTDQAHTRLRKISRGIGNKIIQRCTIKLI